jgi:hypothetical protein
MGVAETPGIPCALSTLEGRSSHHSDANSVARRLDVACSLFETLIGKKWRAAADEHGHYCFAITL